MPFLYIDQVLNENTHTHTHTNTRIYIYIYIYKRVCARLCEHLGAFIYLLICIKTFFIFETRQIHGSSMKCKHASTLFRRRWLRELNSFCRN